jgi:hypothetical protein
MERAHRVRADEPDAALAVDDHHAVADARGFLELELAPHEGERAVDDHAGETVEHVEVLTLELTGTTRDGSGRLAAHYRDGSLAPAHRHALEARPLAPDLAGAQQRRDPRRDLGEVPGPGNERTLDLVDHAAHEVVRVRGRAGGGSDLREHHERAPRLAGHRCEQQQVREREVGQHLPRRHQVVEVLELVVAEAGLEPRQLEHRDGHAHDGTAQARG